jgi:hypothetical protein
MRVEHASDALRVAIFLGSAHSSSSCGHRSAGREVAAHPAHELVGLRVAPSRRARRVGIAARGAGSRQRSAISREDRTGSASHTSCLRAAATSSSPSAAPWVADVPCLLGAPQPMMVRQAISEGRGIGDASS